MIFCFIYTNEQTKQVKVMLLIIALILLLQNRVFSGKQKIKYSKLKVFLVIFPVASLQQISCLI